MNAITFHRATSPDDAVELAQDLGPDSAFIAGGQSLVNRLKQRELDDGTSIIDISGLDDLAYVSESEEAIRIGALMTHAELLNSETLAERLPVLQEMIHQVADVQVRSLGTIGGNLARGDPIADYPVLLTALDASLTTRGPDSTRQIAIADFFIDYFETALSDHELVTEISIPLTGSTTGRGFRKYATRKTPGRRDDGRGDFALVNTAGAFAVEGGIVNDTRLVVGAVRETPVRVSEAEAQLEGTIVGDVDAEQIGGLAAGSIDIDTHDRRVSPSYKRRLIQSLVERTIDDCLEDLPRGES